MVVWVWGFFGLFLQQPLPNNGGLLRREVAPYLPFAILDTLDPPADETSLPRGPAYLPERLPLWGIAIVSVAAAWGAGTLLLSRLRLERLDHAERHYFATLIGLGLLSLFVLGSGYAGALSTGWFWIVELSLIGAGGWRTWRGLKSTAATPSPPAGTQNTTVSRWWWIAAAPFVLGLWLGALTPTTDFDSLEYHLGGPKEWLLAGRIMFLEHDVYTSFPFLTEMLLLNGMVLGGDWWWGSLAGQGTLAAFPLVTAAGIACLGRRWASPAAGVAGAVIWLSTPWVMRITIIPYAEGGLIAFVFGALYAAGVVGETWSRSDGAPFHWGEVGLIGLCAGGAMACKYTGLVLAVVLCGIWLLWGLWRTRHNFSDGIRARSLGAMLLAYTLGVGLLIGPWLLKNLVETGNPVYPLAYRIFGGRDLDDAWAAQWSRGHARPSAGSVGGELRDLAMKAFDVAAVNDWQTPLLGMLLPLAWLTAVPRGRLNYLAMWVGWLFFAWWLGTHHIDRFWLPILPPAAVLAGIGLTAPGTILARNLVGLAVAAAWLFNLGFVSTGMIGYHAGLTKLVAARELAARTFDPVMVALNDATETGALGPAPKVLSVGQAGLFYARFPYAYNTVFDRSLLETWCGVAGDVPSKDRTFKPTDEIRAKFAEEGITHIYVCWGEILRYRQPYSYGYSDFVHPDRFKKLIELGVLGPPLSLPAGLGLRRIEAPEEDSIRLAREWAPELIEPCGPNGEQCLRTGMVYPVLR